MIRVVHPGFRIQDPGSRGKKSTRSRIRIHNTKIFKIAGSGLLAALGTGTYHLNADPDPAFHSIMQILI